MNKKEESNSNEGIQTTNIEKLKEKRLSAPLKGILKVDRIDERSRSGLSDELSIGNSYDRMSKNVDCGSFIDQKYRNSIQFEEFSNNSDPYQEAFIKKEVRFNLEANKAQKSKKKNKKKAPKSKKKHLNINNDFEVASEGEMGRNNEDMSELNDAENMKLRKKSHRCVSSVRIGGDDSPQEGSFDSNKANPTECSFQDKKEPEIVIQDLFTPSNVLTLDDYTVAKVELLNGQSFPLILPNVL